MINLFFNLRVKLLSNNYFFRFLKPFLLIIYRIILLIYGASIPLNTRFKNRLILPHSLYGIFISGDALIGGNVTVFQQVTIGSVTTEGSKLFGAPCIGNNVIIGAGAKIIGNIQIGDDVRIGANCVVAENIPNGKTVVMPRARVI